jgi:hypothetical protein
LRGRNKAESRIQKSRGPQPEKFGAQVILDHIIAERKANEGYKGQTAALPLIDRAANFPWGRRLLDEGGKSCLEVMRRSQGPLEDDEINYVCFDNAPEISDAIEELGVKGFHDTPPPGDSRANGVAECHNKDIKLGTAATMTRAGMPLAYWPLALPCYCFGTNIAVLDGCSPYQKRFGGNFDYNTAYPFGSEVLFIPNKVSGGDQLQFEPKAAVGIFLGYSVNSGCVWSGAYIVAHVGEFVTMNYRTGRRRGDDKFVAIQIAREVFCPDNIT